MDTLDNFLSPKFGFPLTCADRIQVDAHIEVFNEFSHAE